MLGTRGRIVLWIVVGVAAVLGVWRLAAGMVRGATLAPIDLGALTLSLPEGAEVVGSYGYGKVITHHGLGVSLALVWRPAKLLEPEVLARTEVGVAVTTGASDARASAVEYRAGDLPTRSVSVRGSGYASETSEILCGGVRYKLRSMGQSDELVARHGAIVASARCHPDASRQADITGAPVVVTLPPGWTQGTPTAAQEIFHGDGATLSLTSLELVDIDKFAATMSAAVAKLGVEVSYGARDEAAVDDGRRHFWPTTVVAKGQTSVGVTALWFCGDGPWIMAQLLEPASKAAPGEARSYGPFGSMRALLSAIHCRPPGAPAPHYPQPAAP
ncbi:MAG: hypothetical protein U1F43_02410 [Myxococcota bacterium]